MTTTDVAELQILCREWQERLNLRHWAVEVQIKYRLDESYQGGECNHNLKHLRATIVLIHPDTQLEKAEGWNEPFDMEVLLVHELIHLYFAPYMNHDDTSLENMAQEQTVEQLALAFVKLKRGGSQ